MDKKFSLVLKHIEELPPLSHIPQKLLELTRNACVDVKTISKLISLEPALVCKILELVNSSFYGLKRKINSIDEAIIILGTSSINTLAFSFYNIQMIKLFPIKFDMTMLWKNSIAMAILSKIISRRLGYINPDEAFVAGLLHNVGFMIIMQFYPEEYKIVLNSKLSDITLNEKRHIGITHEEIGSILLEQWNFPIEITKSIHIYENQQHSKLDEILLIANLLSIVNGSDFENTIKYNKSMLENWNLQPQDYKDILKDLDGKYESLIEFFDLNIKVDAKKTNDKEFVFISKDKELVQWIEVIFEYNSLNLEIHTANENFENKIILIDGNEPIELFAQVANTAKKVIAYDKKVANYANLPFAFSAKTLEEVINEQ